MHMMVNVSSVSFFTSTTYFNLVTYDCVPFGFRIKCFNLICIAQCAKEKNFCDVPLTDQMQKQRTTDDDLDFELPIIYANSEKQYSEKLKPKK